MITAQNALETIKNNGYFEVKMGEIICFDCGKKVNKTWMVFSKEVFACVQKCRECSGNKGFWRKGVIRKV